MEVKLVEYKNTIVYSEEGKRKKRYIKLALYKCFCGREFVTRCNSVNSGRTKSCGCLHNKGNHTTHGLSKKTPVYNIWCGMKQRCYYTKNKHYADYGGRGITICESWINAFEEFYKYIGERPSKYHSIDRINNDGNYEPGNVRWATSIEQARNKRRAY